MHQYFFSPSNFSAFTKAIFFSAYQYAYIFYIRYWAIDFLSLRFVFYPPLLHIFYHHIP